MAKQRYVDTRFWDDSYIVSLNPMEKLVFIYLITNPLTNVTGAYELPIQRAAFDIGFSIEEVSAVFEKLEASGKLIRWNGWVCVVNFIKYQNYTNSNIQKGMQAELKRVPVTIKERLYTLYHERGISLEALPHPDPDSGSGSESDKKPDPESGSDPKQPPPKPLPTGNPQDIKSKIDKVIERLRGGKQ